MQTLSLMAVVTASLLLLIGGLFKGPNKGSARATPDRSLTTRERWWSEAKPRPEDVPRIDKAVSLYVANKSRYERVQKMRNPGCPAPVIFVFHMRESTWSFGKHLHEGSPLTSRTRWVPKGRPLGRPPFSWETSSEDALYILKRYDTSDKWRNIDAMLDWIEKYNGTGYRRFHPDVPSPYVVAGSNLQKPGKYVADGKFSKTAWDKQLGCLIILKELEKRGLWTAPPY